MHWEELKAAVLNLSPEKRAQLAHALLLSLEELSETEIEQLWVEVALKRNEEIVSGQIAARPAEEVLKDARTRL